MKSQFLKILSFLIFSAMNLQAHNFFVNINESMAHKPGSISTSIGWGHAMPVDDFYRAQGLKSYTFYDPSLKKSELPFDKSANKNYEKEQYNKPSKDFPSANIVKGDSYALKILFNDKSEKGTYQLAAKTKRVQFSVWKDKNGREKWGRVYLDEIKDAKEIKICKNYQSFAKSFVSLGRWSEPKVLGHALEIVPISDLSKAKVGDEIEFKVLLNGKPLTSKTDGKPALKAYNEFYNPDAKYSINASIDQNAIAKIKLTNPGRWLMIVNTEEKVDEKTAKDLVGKALTVGYNASATFFVKN